MLLRREVVIAFGPEFMMLDIAVLVGAVRHLVERQIGDGRQNILKHHISVFRRLFELRHLGLEIVDLGHQRIGSRVVLGLLGLADVLRRRIAARLRQFGRGDGSAPLFVQFDQPLRLAGQPAALQRAIEGLGVVADPFDVVHGSIPYDLAMGSGALSLMAVAEVD